MSVFFVGRLDWPCIGYNLGGFLWEFFICLVTIGFGTLFCALGIVDDGADFMEGCWLE